MNVWKVILAALVIFAAGVVTGGITVRLSIPPSARNEVRSGPPVPIMPQQRIEFARRLQQELNLTSDQRSHVDEILRQSQEKMRALWQPIAPVAREEAKAVRKKIREELTPEQQKIFDQNFKGRLGPLQRELQARPSK